MSQSVSRRVGVLVLAGAACAGTVAVAGCGGGAASAADAKGTSPGAKLIDEAFGADRSFSKDGGSATFQVKGSVTAPKDKDLQQLSGEARLDVSERPAEKGDPIPPLSVAFSARGTDKDGSGKPGSGDYRGGVTYLDGQLYASWQGKDYAAGDALTKKLLGAVKQQWSQQGIDPTNPTSPQMQKLVAAMDLDPGSWLKSTTVSEGGTLDGVDTDKVTGPIDPRATADDITNALRNLGKAMPQNPGAGLLQHVKDISDKDMKDAEQALSVLDATVWIGKQDHRLRKLVVQVKFDDKTGDDPSSGDFTVEMTESTKPTPFEAPKDPAPIAGLFSELEKQFGGPGGPLSGMFSAPKTA